MKEKISEFGKKMRINEKMINYLLIFILGFLVGVAVKTEAKKRITIGYGDYLTADMKQDFDLMKPETKSVQEAPADTQENNQGSDASQPESQ